MPEKKDFSCPECAAEFKTQEELDGHNNRVHHEQKGAPAEDQQPQKKKTA